MRKFLLTLLALLLSLPVVFAQKGVLFPAEDPVEVSSEQDFQLWLNRSNEAFRQKNFVMAPDESAADLPLFEGIKKEFLKKNPNTARKPWQVLMFFGAEKSSLHERTVQNALIEAMKAGHVARAVIAVMPSQKRGIKADSTFSLYVFTSENGQLKVERVNMLRAVSMDLLTNSLFSFIGNGSSKDFYTAVVYDIHGSPSGMHVGNGSEDPMDERITMQHLVSAAETYDLFIDVLDLISCQVNSLHGMLPLLRSNRVGYVLASSNVAIARNGWAPALFSVLNYAPQAAAQLAIQEEEKILRPDMLNELLAKITGNNDAYNMVLFSPEKLRPVIDEWLPLAKKVAPKLPFEESYLYGKARTDADGSVWSEIKLVSFYNFAKKMGQMVDKSQDISDDLKEQFTKVNNRLKSSLSTVFIAQWCFSRKHNKYYTLSFYAHQMPAEDSECLSTMSVYPAFFAQPVDGFRGYN